MGEADQPGVMINESVNLGTVDHLPLFRELDFVRPARYAKLKHAVLPIAGNVRAKFGECQT